MREETGICKLQVLIEMYNVGVLYCKSMLTWAEITLRQHHLWPSQCFVLIKPEIIEERKCLCEILYYYIGHMITRHKMSYIYLQSDSPCPLQF